MPFLSLLYILYNNQKEIELIAFLGCMLCKLGLLFREPEYQIDLIFVKQFNLCVRFKSKVFKNLDNGVASAILRFSPAEYTLHIVQPLYPRYSSYICINVLVFNKKKLTKAMQDLVDFLQWYWFKWKYVTSSIHTVSYFQKIMYYIIIEHNMTTYRQQCPSLLIQIQLLCFLGLRLCHVCRHRLHAYL